MNAPKLHPNPFRRLIAASIFSLLLLAILLIPNRTASSSEAALPAQAAPPVLSIDSGSTPFGGSLSLPIILSHAPDGLSGFNLTVKMDNPGVAKFVDVEFPNFGMTIFNIISDSEAQIAAADVNNIVQSGAVDIQIATLVIHSLSEGMTNLNLTVGLMDTGSGDEIVPVVNSGVLTILNIVPIITVASDTLSIDEGETFTASVTITDPGDNSWTVSADYGDGTVETLAIVDTSFVLTHVYSEAGTYTATFVVADDDGANSADSVQIQVNSVIILPNMVLPSQDLDGDGTNEDLNGNSRLDFADVIALFEHLDSGVVQQNPEYFDFNGNAILDMGDVVALFELIVSN